MSLINDALKKAARQRAQDQGEYAPPMPGAGGRGSPGKGTNYALIGGAAVVLVVVTVVATGLFVNKAPEPKPVVAAPTMAPIVIGPKTVTQTAAPIQLTVPALPDSSASEVKAPPVTQAPARVEVAAPTSAPIVLAVPTTVPTRVASVPAPVSPPAAAAAATPAPIVIESQSDRIQAFIDALQVSGVRYAGADSKAIIGGHIYRVNDILDRSLGLRLKKVDTDHLTFVDASGATFVKNF